jgi:Xaa-Pro aminopeptidase
MLSQEGCVARRTELHNRRPDCDLLLIAQPEHIFYLSGFRSAPTELASYGPSFLLIDRAGKTRLVTDNWNAEAAQAAHVDDAVIWDWYDFVRPAPEKYAAASNALLQALPANASSARIAADQAYLPTRLAAGLGTALVDDLTPILNGMRRQKYPDEITCIRRAIQATEAGHAAARRCMRAGLREIDIYTEVQAAIVKAAGEPIVMLGDFAAGPRALQGGGPPTTNEIRPGDLMILDLFPLIGGYRADITNTLCAGSATDEQLRLLAALTDALAAGEALLRPGETGAAVYQACREALAHHGFARWFPHHAGHGLGLGHPEPPYLVPASNEVLQPGQIITLEPGAYVPEIGGVRIEHDYLITEAGMERLSQHTLGF